MEPLWGARHGAAGADPASARPLADTIAMRVPVLTYHSNNILGNDYGNNDHVALAEDLARIHAAGRRIVPISRVVDVLLGAIDAAAVENAVALCCDDGSWFDWYDIDHPTCGLQRSFANILRDFAAETGAPVHMTSFVIVSPAARAMLDRTCLVGRGWWTDDWWADAEREGLIAIESHSWDHNHATLSETAQRDGRRGTFRSIDTYAVADAEIRQASDWLDAHARTPRPGILAFPYGEANEYLPRHAAEHRLRAAFGTDPRPVGFDSDRWNLPRYVCGQHWRSSDALVRLLESRE